jgi:hypothetical protein
VKPIVLDIETVPQDFFGLPAELQALVWQRATRGLPEAPSLEAYLAHPGAVPPTVQEALERWMACRPAFGHIVCAAIGLETQPGTLDVTMFIARSTHPDDERDLLRRLWAAIAAVRPRRLVTYNGLRFDAPYLLMRSAILGVPTCRLPLARYRPDDHCDVMQLLANWEAAESLPLAAAARLFGVAKDARLNGAAVAAAWKAGRIEDIAAYCAQDVQATYAIFQRLAQAGLC